tara:strand:+ start:15516 stop:16133 length:618 start_codon:yes stop_codon:yes gene_type:complete
MAKQEYSIAQQLRDLYTLRKKSGNLGNLDNLDNLDKLANLVEKNEKVINHLLHPRQVNELSNLLLNLGKLYIQDDRKGLLNDRNWLDDQDGAVEVLKKLNSMMQSGILDCKKLPENTGKIGDFINEINLATGTTNENDRKREINREYKQELKSFPARHVYETPGPIDVFTQALQKAKTFAPKNALERRPNQNRNHSDPHITRKPR